MQLKRLSLDQVQDAGGPEDAVRLLRHLAPISEVVVARAREIVGEVFKHGDDAVLELTRMHDTRGAEPRPLVVSHEELDEAIQRLPLDLVAGLQIAIANVAQVAQAGVGEETSVTMPQGQRVTLREVPVRSAAVYVPGGRAPYPSTAVMGVVTARAAGVTDVVVCSPPGPDGEIEPVILGTCRLLGVERVYRMGGAQAIAALAIGTATVERVDVIVGPGNRYVQEAKREVAGVVGIDGFAGPSDLMVVLGDDADAGLAAVDLLAQAEHGGDTLVVAISHSADALNAVEEQLRLLLPTHVPKQAEGESPDASSALCVLMQSANVLQAIEIANAFAPEHLQLMGVEPEALAPKVRSAGCLLVGGASATAFSDYVAGSNHILPTGGAARFSSGLSTRHFRRRMSEVRIDPEAASKLARAGAPIARAEGFEWHARSMEARTREPTAEKAVTDDA